MFRRFRLLLLVGAALFTLAALVTGCSGDGATDLSAADASGTATPVVLIDVRTPAEFAAGHLDGARNIDLQSAAFDSSIAALDPDAAYLVYCRSGSRSAQAVARMEAAGFTRLTDAGGLDAAAESTGLPIVTG
ncbi:rhodanese-like domain-containing protein [Rhodococcus sp. NPDC058505]|uniref:rhodanese-like domain-containing protein n=1 Tax=Rhodococcus sp. NPDC058505 TaxID=3346531 RepID=UPI0036502A8A